MLTEHDYLFPEALALEAKLLVTLQKCGVGPTDK